MNDDGSVLTIELLERAKKIMMEDTHPSALSEKFLNAWADKMAKRVAGEFLDTSFHREEIIYA